MLAANTGWDIKAVAWVLFIGVLVNVSYCWSPAAQPARLLQQLKFLMAITQHAQSCSTCWSMGHISLCCTDSGAAACISGKGKALSWAECRGAWHDINENMAVMSCSHQPCLDPAWQPPAEPLSTTRDSCHLTPAATPSSHHTWPAAIHRHTSPLCLPEAHQAIWDLQPCCAHMAAAVLGLVLPSRTRFVLFPLWLSLRLFEQNSTSFQLPQFDQSYF